MGLAHLPEISTKLIAAGLPADTPATAIANGTTREQQTCVTTLAGLPQAATEHGLRAPVTVIIGKVVAMAAVLAGADAGFGTEGNREQFGAD
jgi:siroheme synthase